jgi:hypothetical protein
MFRLTVYPCWFPGPFFLYLTTPSELIHIFSVKWWGNLWIKKWRRRKLSMFTVRNANSLEGTRKTTKNLIRHAGRRADISKLGILKHESGAVPITSERLVWSSWPKSIIPTNSELSHKTWKEMFCNPEFSSGENLVAEELPAYQEAHLH